MIGDGLQNGKLDLPLDCLFEATATRLHLAVIEAVMLWPDDAPARTRAFHSEAVEFLRRGPDEADAGFLIREDLRGVDFGFDAFKFAAAAPPIGDVIAEAREPYMHGVIAGFVLDQTVGKVALQRQDARVADSIQAAEKAFWPSWRVMVKTINNSIWPRYRCVSHLWAAHWRRASERQDASFPCGRADIATFLSTADAFRKLGESCRTYKSPRPLLVPSETIRAPFPLSTVDLKFEPSYFGGPTFPAQLGKVRLDKVHYLGRHPMKPGCLNDRTSSK